MSRWRCSGRGSLHLDLGGSALDLAQVIGGQLEGGCSEVLVQVLHPAGAEVVTVDGGAGTVHPHH